MHSLYYFIIIARTCIYNLFPQHVRQEGDKAEEQEWGYLGVISDTVAPLETLCTIHQSNNLITLLALQTAEILTENLNSIFIMLILRYPSNYLCVNEARFKLFTSNSKGQEV